MHLYAHDPAADGSQAAGRVGRAARALVEEARRYDPVPTFERLLLDEGVIDEAAVAQLKADVLRDTNEATDTAELAPFPAAEDLYKNVYEGTHEPWL